MSLTQIAVYDVLFLKTWIPGQIIQIASNNLKTFSIFKSKIRFLEYQFSGNKSDHIWRVEFHHTWR